MKTDAERLDNIEGLALVVRRRCEVQRMQPGGSPEPSEVEILAEATLQLVRLLRESTPYFRSSGFR